MSTILEGTFTTTAQVSPIRLCETGTRVIVILSGTWAGSIQALSFIDGSAGETILGTITEPGVYEYTRSLSQPYVRLRATLITSGTAYWRFEGADSYEPVGDFEWDDLRFPAQGINPAGSTAAPGVETTETGFPGALLFDNGTSEMIAGNAQMPHSWALGTPVRPHIHWSKTTSAVGGVVWHFYYRFLSPGSAAGAWVGPVVGVRVVHDGDTADSESITTFGSIATTGKNPSFNIHWRLYRMPGESEDTYAADARLHELDFHYQKDSLGTGAEFRK